MSVQIMIIFNNTSAEIKTKSIDVLLKMITILKELRITQLCSKNGRYTHSSDWLQSTQSQVLSVPTWTLPFVHIDYVFPIFL